MRAEPDSPLAASRLGRRVRRLCLAVGLCGLVGLVLVGAGPAAADATRAAEIADDLATSPVAVHDSVESVLAPEDQAALADQIEDSPVPIFVVVEPLAAGDTWSGDGTRLLAAVHERLGVDGEYLTRNPNGRLIGETFGVAESDAHRAATVVSEDDTPMSTAEEFERAVDLIASGDARAAFQEYRERETERLEAENAEPATDGGMPWGVLAVTGGGLALTIGAAVLISRLVASRRSGEVFLGVATVWNHLAQPWRRPAPSSQVAFDNAQESQDDADTQRLHNDLVTIGRRTAAIATDDAAAASLRAHKLALDCHQAAGKVLDAAENPLRRAGARVLLDQALDALAVADGSMPHTATPPAHCFFNPLHARTEERVTWREAGSSRSMEVFACDRCAQAVAHHLPPRSLTVEYNGQTVPYFEVPAAESVWSATGFGSHSGDLPHRILRGAPLG